MKTATTQMLNGELGSSPSVDASFELYVDSTTEVADYPMSVQLVCAAPVTSFDYDAKVVTVETEGSGDFKGRRFTFRQKDLTKAPSWADVSFSMDGTGADWLDDTGTETLFTLRASGFEKPLPLGYADLTNNNDSYLARGGTYAAEHHARHKFDVNGAVILSITNVGPGAVGGVANFQGWSALRLMLKDAAHLTFADITARAFIDGSFTGVQPTPRHMLLRRTGAGADGWLHVLITAHLDVDRIQFTFDARQQGLAGSLDPGNVDYYPFTFDPLSQTGGTSGYSVRYQFSDGSTTDQYPYTPHYTAIAAGQVNQVSVTPAQLGHPGKRFFSFQVFSDGYPNSAAHSFNMYTEVIGEGTGTAGRPATVRLGPVVEGLRTLDLSWQNNAAFHHFDATHEIQVVLNAPILKHLLVWEKTTQIPVVENDGGGRGSDIEVYYNPAVSYSSGYRAPQQLSDWTKMSSRGLAIDMNLFIALEGLVQGPFYPMGGWRPDIAFGNPASVSSAPGRQVEMVDQIFNHSWPGLLNYAGTAMQQGWSINVSGNKDALLVEIGTSGYQLQIIVQVETTSGTWTSFGIAGNVPPGDNADPAYYVAHVVSRSASPESLCQALDGSHWTGRVRFSDLRNDSPDLIWDGGTPEESTIPVAAAYIPHAVRNIDITVTPSTDITTVEAGTERGHFS